MLIIEIVQSQTSSKLLESRAINLFFTYATKKIHMGKVKE